MQLKPCLRKGQIFPETDVVTHDRPGSHVMHFLVLSRLIHWRVLCHDKLDSPGSEVGWAGLVYSTILLHCQQHPSSRVNSTSTSITTIIP